MKICCCLEHVELALDIIVDEYECPPTIHNVDKGEGEQKACEYCQNLAIYVVSEDV